MTTGDLSHSTILYDSLEHLQDEPDELPDLPSPSRSTRSSLHDGYGFRPPSGSSTPSQAHRNASPLPDRHGLGWPGELSSCETLYTFNLRIHLAKSTISRLTATPAEKKDRQEKLAAAVRTILECLGEDPDREGLVRTPERYAQALMWMTKGYEERLAGRKRISSTLY